jgi:hypothetical protein
MGNPVYTDIYTQDRPVRIGLSKQHRAWVRPWRRVFFGGLELGFFWNDGNGSPGLTVSRKERK